MGLLRIEDRVFIGCVVAEWTRSENTFLGPLLQFSEFRVQSRSYVIYDIFYYCHVSDHFCIYYIDRLSCFVLLLSPTERSLQNEAQHQYSNR